MLPGLSLRVINYIIILYTYIKRIIRLLKNIISIGIFPNRIKSTQSPKKNYCHDYQLQ